MDLMKAPQEWNLVEKTVCDVRKEIGDEHRLDELEPDRLGPD